MKPVVLCIMDGCGIREDEYGNAFLQAHAENFNNLVKEYPHSKLDASGKLVGLPEGQMGNSEVGHMNIGAGRIVYQPLELINSKIEDQTFYENENILEVMNHVKKNNSKLHIFGLLSDGGVHSHISHLFALIDMCKKEQIERVYYHVFLDGRDTLPDLKEKFLKQLDEKIKETNIGSIATISGRYYAMDRDNRWDRVELAYNAIVKGEGLKVENYQELVEKTKQEKITDEFVIPTVVDKEGMVLENDGLIVYNFRPDRLRELFQALTSPSFDGFERSFIPNLKLVTMMKVSDDVITTNAFKLDALENTFGEYIVSKGYTQLRIAETEKYAHVTYFFDGGLEKNLKGCKRILVPSPKVATYDLKPEMSADEVTEKLLEEIENYDVVILNFANGDMVGHTGVLSAAIKAVKTVDKNLGKVYKKVKELGGILLVTADHGNCEEMIDKEGNILTAHTTNLVPFIVTKKGINLKDGKLGDIAPTMLQLMEEEIPSNMTGNSLITE